MGASPFYLDFWINPFKGKAPFFYPLKIYTKYYTLPISECYTDESYHCRWGDKKRATPGVLCAEMLQSPGQSVQEKSRLFHPGKIIFWVSIKNHTAYGNWRKVSIEPDFGNINGSKRYLLACRVHVTVFN